MIHVIPNIHSNLLYHILTQHTHLHVTKVTPWILIKSHLGVQVLIDSMQLLTTSGINEVPNLEHHKAERSLSGNISFRTKYGSDQGIKLNPNELEFLFTELIIPSNLTLPDGSAVDTLKFTPKTGRWCNAGLSCAAGNICESKYSLGVYQKFLHLCSTVVYHWCATALYYVWDRVAALRC